MEQHQLRAALDELFTGQRWRHGFDVNLHLRMDLPKQNQSPMHEGVNDGRAADDGQLLIQGLDAGLNVLAIGEKVRRRDRQTLARLGRQDRSGGAIK